MTDTDVGQDPTDLPAVTFAGGACPTLRPDVDDPDGTVTCSCGEVFTGANFADRMSQWREHTEATHA